MIGGLVNNLNEKVVRATLQDHIDAGRTPVEAAGETSFLDEVMVEQGILEKETAQEDRRIIESWLEETLDVSPQELNTYLQLADEYTQFLRERVLTKPKQMPLTDRAWRDWRQARG
jgi:hypothetical protein